jgi:mono/diheme cytochrome c family protein
MCLPVTCVVALISGCGKSDSAAQVSPGRGRGDVTFNRDIAPIVFEHCAPCHRPGQAGPFDLLTYADAKKRAKEIAEVTAKRAMPPWLLEPGYGEFKDERRLSGEQIQLIGEWVATGATEGSAADLPPLPQWSDEWQLGEPDLVLRIPEPTHCGNRDVWRTFIIPAPLQSNRFVRAMEFRPGNKCVHHAAMRFDRTPQSRLRDENDPGLGFGGITTPDTARPPAGHMLNWLLAARPISRRKAWPGHSRRVRTCWCSFTCKPQENRSGCSQPLGSISRINRRPIICPSLP